MDSSQGALNRVLRWAAFRHDIVLQGSICRHSRRSMVVDDQLEALNEHGDTELLFLLSFHQTSVETLETFFRKNAPLSSALLSQTNKDGVNALHMAVFRNSFHASAIVSWLLEHGGPSLAKATMVHESSLPLHILVTHAVTLDGVVWDRILHAYPAGAGMADANGTTPLQMLYQNVQRFRWATEALMTGLEVTGDEEKPNMTTDSLTSPKKLGKALPLLRDDDDDDDDDDWAYMTIITPRQYVKYSLQLIGAIHHQKQHPSLHTVVATPQCPVLLVHLLLHHSSCTLVHRDDQGRIPLHTCCPHNAELLIYLTRSATTALPSTTTRSYNGQRPLHTCPALLVARAAPQALWVQDPVTHLWPWSLAGTTTPHTKDMVNTIFALLRMEPGVLAFQRRQQQRR